MSDPTAPLRVLAFASPQDAMWGGLIATETGTALVLGAGQAREATAAGVTLTDGETGWSVSADGTELTVDPVAGTSGDAPPDDRSELDPELGSPAEPCTVRGHVAIGGATIDLECPGLRFRIAVENRRDAGSLRAVAGWFGPELSLALGSLRPQRSRGHDHDRISATLLESGRPRMVDEPRLSTTLLDDGLPARMSMELWVAEGEDLYPRRAAGEAAGPGAQTAAGTPQLAGVPLTCHLAGRDGAGVYLLANFA